MEDTHWDKQKYGKFIYQKVLILVLMEDTHWVQKIHDYKPKSES